MNVAPSFEEALRRNRVESPDRVALADRTAAFTWERLATDATSVAAALRRWRADDMGTVVLALPSSPRWVLAFLACRIAGLTVASAGTPRSESDLRDLCLETGAVGIVGDNAVSTPARHVATRLGVGYLDLTHLQAALAPEPGAGNRPRVEGAAALHFTSGTTGRRVAVPRGEAGLVNEGRAIAEALATIEGPVTIVSPIFHSFGAGLLAAALVTGRTALPIARFRIGDVLDSISSHRATVLVGVPYVFQCLAQASLSSRHDTRSLRLGIAGGTTLHEELIVRFCERFGATLVQEYGLSEVGVVSLNLDDPDGRPCSVGRPLRNLEMTTEPVGAGRDGELIVRLARDRDLGADRVEAVPTGDLGHVDEAGFVTLTGRLKHQVNVAGVKVAPQEVERRMLAGGKLEDAAVVGVPDDVLGERVAAAVVSRAGSPVNAEEFHSRCRQVLRAHEIPRRVLWLDELPRLTNGKPDLQSIRRRLASEEVRKDASIVAE